MDKSPFKSKTLWSALFVAMAAFVPPVHTFIQANPELYGILVGALFAFLRSITKGKLVIE